MDGEKEELLAPEALGAEDAAVLAEADWVALLFCGSLR